MTEILTNRVVPRGDRWEVGRDGHDGVLADFATKDEAVRWAQSEAGKIGMGRLVIADADGGVESQRDFLDDAVREELHLP